MAIDGYVDGYFGADINNFKKTIDYKMLTIGAIAPFGSI